MADYPRKNMEMLSGQYGTNVLLIGAAMMLAMVQNDHSTKEESLLSFLTSLMIIQLIWMIWYTMIRDKQKNLKTERDVHVTTCYIRGGLTVVALLSLVMDGFRIEYYVGYRACLSVLHLVYPVIHATHTIAQVYFFWFHIKDVIKNFETFERFGVIHAVFTNLLLWLNGVMSEAEEFLNNHLKKLPTISGSNITIVRYEPKCNCTISACSTFSNSLYYLYPFNVEYHIFAAAMLYVMWKNIGRSIDHFSNHKKRITKTYGLILGPFLGLLVLVSTIGILVVYIIHIDEGSVQTHHAAISMFYSYAIIMLVLMCSAGISGLLIYRADHVPMDTAKNPSRQLDAELLLGSSVCTWLMYWCSVVAMLDTRSNPPYRWAGLAYSLLSILENYIQNIFIIESLYRHQEDEEPAAPDIFSVTSSLEPPDYGILNQAYKTPNGFPTENEPDQSGPAYSCQTFPAPETPDWVPTENEPDQSGPAYSCQTFPAPETPDWVPTENEPDEGGPAYSCQSIPAPETPDWATTENEPDQSGQASIPSRRPYQVSHTMGQKQAKQSSIKRPILKNIAVFLIFCNISLWILPAFGCRPQYDNGLEEEKYGLSIWNTIINFAVPMNLFYHMHSVASLFEVFRHA